MLSTISIQRATKRLPDSIFWDWDSCKPHPYKAVVIKPGLFGIGRSLFCPNLWDIIHIKSGARVWQTSSRFVALLFARELANCKGCNWDISDPKKLAGGTSKIVRMIISEYIEKDDISEDDEGLTGYFDDDELCQHWIEKHRRKLEKRRRKQMRKLAA